MPDRMPTGGRLLLVIPTVMDRRDGSFVLDTHFAHNLTAYLRHFDHVTIACPLVPIGAASGTSLSEIDGHERVTCLPLPMPYREDRYLLHYLSVRRLLRREIAKADYLSFSPHSAFDWSTMAARQAASMGRPYDMEGDWDLENVWSFLIRSMPPGLNRLRKQIWLKLQMRAYLKCMRGSALALLQGQDVFDAYKDVAPNPHKVLNVQITAGDLVPLPQLERKLASVRSGAPLSIVYAGRAAAMKGPHDWVETLDQLVKSGVPLQAAWLGAGEMLEELRTEVDRRGLAKHVSFVGNIPREEVLQRIRDAHLFLFCHLTAESPRCIVESLACGTPIVGYGSGYVRDLVAEHGGGTFVDAWEPSQLADLVRSLDGDREQIARLATEARMSASQLDRDKAIENRIALIRHYLSAGAGTS